MRHSIKIGDIALDLDESTIISTTKRVANIGTLERQSSYTNKLTIPPTANNLNAIGFVQGNDDNQAKYQSILGSISSSGIEIMNNALLKFESLQDKIELSINSDNSVFYDSINKLNLRDLDLSELDHIWRMQSEYESINHDYTDGYIYAICNTGNQSTYINNLQCQGVMPSVFAKYLFYKIALNFGYTIEGEFWNDPFFDSILIPVVTARIGGRNIYELQLAVTKTTDQLIPNEDSNIWIEAVSFNAPTDIYNSLWVDKWGVWTGNKYRIKIPGTYTFSLDFEIDVAKQFPGDFNNLVQSIIRLRAYMQIGGVFTEIAKNEYPIIITGSFNDTISISFQFDEYIVDTQNPNVFVSIEVYQKKDLTPVPGNPYYSTITTLTYCKLRVDSITNANVTHYNRVINIQESLPDWTCGKLFKEVCNLAAVIPVVNEYDKKIRLMLFNEIDDNKKIAKNWQSKIDSIKKPKYTFKVDGYAQRMTLQYKQDNSFGADILIDNKTLPNELKYVKSEFLWIDPSRIFGFGFNTVLINIWNSEKSRIIFDDKVRIGFLFKKNNNLIYTTPNESNYNFTPGTELPYLGFQKQNSLEYSMHWEDLYEKYYERLIAGITNSILKIEMDFRLDEFDINDFDFSIPIYLENPSGYYYVQELRDFTTSSESTTIEMVRIG